MALARSSRPASKLGLFLWLAFQLFVTCHASDDNYSNQGNNYYNNNTDDANAGDDDDAQNGNYTYKNSGSSNYYGQIDDWVNYNKDFGDDDLFHWNKNVGFDGVSIMPVSCVNYNNGHMIKFEFFETETSYQCHFSEIGTFVVSIAHYMRAYFNYQALTYGADFKLPADVGYLNCVKLQETANWNEPLYAKIGCMKRETFTSTKLALHLYTDQTCSTPYDDGYPSRRHSTKGYDVRGNLVSSQVSFRPPFYSCHTCSPDVFSDTFNKRAGTWYDDDYISAHGAKRDREENNQEVENDEDDNAEESKYYDDYYTDDGYLSANDDVQYGNRRLDEIHWEQHDSEYIPVHVEQVPRKLTPVKEEFEAFEKEFWESIELQQRSLYENAYDVGDWNMCQRVYRYGLWCDEECRSLDAFRTDQWSTADMILLGIMCSFLTSMMLLVVAKRLKAAQKQRMYLQDDVSLPGLPPITMLAIYVIIIAIITVMAKFKFINETLVFAVVTCLLLFIYMLKLTLFDNRRPVLLAAARHDIFDNPMDERLFD